MILSQPALNILNVWTLASGAQVSEGRNWYAVAQDAAHEFAGRYGVDVAVAAGIIAALSPSNPWEKNLKDAELVLAGWAAGVAPADVRRPNGKGVGMGALLAKCDRILGGEDIATVLNGQKITAFWQCIMGDLSAVCVDGHAANIARHGARRVSIVSDTARVTAKQYKDLAAAYVEAAGVLGEEPAVVQAVTWTVYRTLPTAAA